jgi:hypothetical protein
MFNSDTAVIEQTKSLARRAEKVLQLADESDRTPEAGAALLALGREVAGALTELSHVVQAHEVLDGVLSVLCMKTETLQRGLAITEDQMVAAFSWKAASASVWRDIPVVAFAFDDDEGQADNAGNDGGAS